MVPKERNQYHLLKQFNKEFYKVIEVFQGE
jgi:hypothetical protein